MFEIGYDELYGKYVSDRLSINQIARKYTVSYSTIWRFLNNYNIVRRGKGDAHKGKIVSLETRSKISEASKGNKKWLGRHHSDASRNKIRGYHLGITLSDDIRNKMSNTHKIRWENPDLKKRVSEAHKRNWQDPEYSSKVVRNTAKAQNKHPNGKETIVLRMFKELGLVNWKFTDTGEYAYGKKRPDFMDITKMDKIIEMFGNYWHVDKVRCYEETEEGRIAHFAKYGFKTLIVWESEIKKTPEVVKSKIAAFVES
jgi:very-short-patch-repair endonuclease